MLRYTYIASLFIVYLFMLNVQIRGQTDAVATLCLLQ
jgi:hypothetical protein